MDGRGFYLQVIAQRLGRILMNIVLLQQNLIHFEHLLKLLGHLPIVPTLHGTTVALYVLLHLVRLFQRIDSIFLRGYTQQKVDVLFGVASVRVLRRSSVSGCNVVEGELELWVVEVVDLGVSFVDCLMPFLKDSLVVLHIMGLVLYDFIDVAHCLGWSDELGSPLEGA